MKKEKYTSLAKAYDDSKVAIKSKIKDLKRDLQDEKIILFILLIVSKKKR